jgi:hypothetical protein
MSKIAHGFSLQAGGREADLFIASILSQLPPASREDDRGVWSRCVRRCIDIVMLFPLSQHGCSHRLAQFPQLRSDLRIFQAL